MKKLKCTCVFLVLIMFLGILFNSCAQKPSQNAIEPSQEEEKADTEESTQEEEKTDANTVEPTHKEEKPKQFTQEEIEELVFKSPTYCNITEGIYQGVENGYAVFRVDPKWGCDFKFPKEQIAQYDLVPNKKYVLYIGSSEGIIFEKTLYLNYIRSAGEITLNDKMSFLNGIGVFENCPNKEHKMSDNITRAEFAAMIIKRDIFIGITYYNQAMPDYPGISDLVGHWARSYIEDAYLRKLITWDDLNAFDPDGLLTYQDMVVMTVRALSDFSSENPADYMNLAKGAGLITDTGRTGYATMQDVCEILYNSHDTQLTEPYDITEEPRGAGKPVIYLYPEKTQEVSVALELDGAFTFTYPQYKDGGWNVTASPDGTITCDGRAYSYLFWEGTMPNFTPDFSKGFIVPREDTVPFLQKVLSEMGLTPREYNEFIVYWAPILSKNAYNKITFDTEQYEKQAKLNITPAPDSILRVYMVYEPAKGDEVLPPQTFSKFERKGFTVVEWGGRMLAD